MPSFIDDWPLTKKMLTAFSFLGLLLIGLAINGWISNRDLTSMHTDDACTASINRGLGNCNQCLTWYDIG